MLIILKKIIALIFCCFLFQACGQNDASKKAARSVSTTSVTTTSVINQNGSTISERFTAPLDFQRIASDSVSFAWYLRGLPLKPVDAKVKYFDGRIKPNNTVYTAVVDLPIGKRDLHQCADAVMRLRAAYFFEQKQYDSIHFNFTNGFKADYANWKKGKRIVVNGNKVRWEQKTNPTNTPEDFWKYLEMVFSYAGTASLEKEMKAIAIDQMQIGDVFIKGGFPGHAVIVVDMAENKAGEKLFLLAQSYIPAQEIQVLQNPNSEKLSPWYRIDAMGKNLRTPEWEFELDQLKRFN